MTTRLYVIPASHAATTAVPLLRRFIHMWYGEEASSSSG